MNNKFPDKIFLSPLIFISFINMVNTSAYTYNLLRVQKNKLFFKMLL
ncbi:hypothetical protein CSC14_0598 [Proteus mirabilis]|nr:hypothetical protein CSC14_0598 [Proteus mirabilis]